MATKLFTVSDGIVTQNHRVIRGLDSIQLDGKSSHGLHAYNKQGKDCCSALTGACPLPLDEAVAVLAAAPEGMYQLGTDTQNNGDLSNGQLNVGSG